LASAHLSRESRFGDKLDALMIVDFVDVGICPYSTFELTLKEGCVVEPRHAVSNR
jgi:hypothetical protein